MSFLYLIDKKNRGDLVENILKKRKEWKPIKYNDKHWSGFYNAMKSYTWNFIWKPTVTDIYDRKFFSNQNSFSLLKIINHFPFPDVITRKTNLLRTLNKHSKFYLNYIPETYIFPDSLNKFETKYKFNSKDNIWIVKPEYLHSGQGIHLFDDINKIKHFFQQNKNLNEKNTEYVIQKYVRNPYLYNGRKFDIRINVLVRSQEIYICPYGFVRTISASYVPYLLENEQKNFLVHITNHSVQKLSKDYSKYEEGNVMSVDNIFDYIAEKTGNKNIRSTLLIEWSKIIIDVISSGFKEGMNNLEDLSNTSNLHNFEMFGFDFMLDENLQTWLLEVNTNPGLEQNNKWASNIVNNMLEELIQICVDVHTRKTKNKNLKYWLKIDF